MDSEKILAYLAIKHEGDWNKIYEAITSKNIDVTNEEIEEVVAKNKSKYVSILSDKYPVSLSYTYHAPFVLFYYGDLSLIQNRDSIFAVVGSRKCSDYAANKTKEIVADLSKKFVIVSGLAKGIDAVAHRAAIESGGKTIGILGGGIDTIYPSENRDLYEIMKNDHLIISEYPGVCEPKAENFPLRNRLIAYCSKGLFVPEAKRKSGTSITVNYSLCVNDLIVCLPHRADEDSYCNELIKKGAGFVENAEDIYDELDRQKFVK